MRASFFVKIRLACVRAKIQRLEDSARQSVEMAPKRKGKEEEQEGGWEKEREEEQSEEPAPKRAKAKEDPVPQQKKKRTDEPYMLGIDEAGRGPVLGPMVYGTCFCPVSRLGDLKKMGFMDSKVLKADDRERLFADIKASEWLEWAVDSISPVDLSAKMMRRDKYNLNAISHDSAMGLIRAALDSGCRVTEVYVDTVGDPGKYQAKLEAMFPGVGKIVVAKKADSIYPIVSAASICAKVTRDWDLEGWAYPEERTGRVKYSREAGSGYPGDANTKRWLAAHVDPVFGFPSLVRFGWSTCKKILAGDGAVPVEWDDDDDEDAGGAGQAKQAKIFAHFSSSSSEQAAKSEVPLSKRPRFFQRRSLQVVSSMSAPAAGV